jgi:hypothetical protein
MSEAKLPGAASGYKLLRGGLGLLPRHTREVCIFLVHGTWGRGVFPVLRISKKPLWFEPGSAFRDKLASDLHNRGVICSFDAFLWSGANSIHHRDDAAKRLSAKIASDVESNPEKRQVILAHSHGGNVTARALGFLSVDISRLLVGYLATPFMELCERKLARLERLILAAAVFLILLGISSIFVITIQVLNDIVFPRFTGIMLLSASYLAAFMFYRWIKSEKSGTKIEQLITATTNLKYGQNHGDALILRAIDDEASLALSVGTLANLLSIYFIAGSTLGMILIMSWAFYLNPLFVIAFAALILTFGLGVISRSVYGRELLYNPPGTQMNVQSVPDFIHSATIRTLLRGDVGTYFSLRHGIYNHPDASAAIADWICWKNN